MKKQTQVGYIDHGHQDILESIQEKYGLSIVDTFRSRHSVCASATTQEDRKVFVKIKGLKKSKPNARRLQRALSANRMASKISEGFVPSIIDFRAFERNGTLWMTTLSAYGGEPISNGFFFVGDDASIGDEILKRLRRCLEVIQETPAASVFYHPREIIRWIKGEFGVAATAAASVWTSAHCDFHWGNILEGAVHIVDWDMFSLAPKGFDLASVALFSSNNPKLFERVCGEFFEEFNDPSTKVATLFAAARLLRMMKTDAYAEMRVYESNVREAAAAIVGITPGAADNEL
jgi:hypothetical protein